jgi:hypothetical protein
MAEVEAEDAQDDAEDELDEQVQEFLSLCHKSKRGNLTVHLQSGHWVTVFWHDGREYGKPSGWKIAVKAQDGPVRYSRRVFETREEAVAYLIVCWDEYGVGSDI